MHNFLGPKPNFTSDDEDEFVDPDFVEPFFQTFDIQLHDIISNEVEIYSDGFMGLNRFIDDDEVEEEPPVAQGNNVLVNLSDSSDSSDYVPEEDEEEEEEDSLSDVEQVAVEELQNAELTPSHPGPHVSPQPEESTATFDVANFPQNNVEDDSSDVSSLSSNDELNSYSNPFETINENENLVNEGIRGDCIGETTYSERHVLKILMKWIQELPKYSQIISEEKNDEVHANQEGPKLETEFRKDLDLLWDMSSEQDVGTYLVDKDVLKLIKATLEDSTNHRLTEVALGILANILSVQEILKDFQEKFDEEMKLVDFIVVEATSGRWTSEVPLLIQVFAILRRLAWYFANVNNALLNPILLSSEFINFLMFLLRGSTNSLLLKDVFLYVFSLLEAFILPVTEDAVAVADQTENDDKQYKCFASTDFIVAICEGMNEMLGSKANDSSSSDLDGVFPSISLSCDVQLALRSALGTLCYLDKVTEGQNSIRIEHEKVSEILEKFFKMFHVICEDLEFEKSSEYFVGGMNLLSACHFEKPNPSANLIVESVQAARRLLEQNIRGDEENFSWSTLQSEKLEVGKTLCIGLAEHIGELGDTFGKEDISKILEKSEDINSFYKFISNLAEEFKIEQTTQKV